VDLKRRSWLWREYGIVLDGMTAGDIFRAEELARADAARRENLNRA